MSAATLRRAELKAALTVTPLSAAKEQAAVERLLARVDAEPTVLAYAAALVYDRDPRVAGLALTVLLEAGGKLAQPLLPYQIHRLHLEGFDDAVLTVLRGKSAQRLRLRAVDEGEASGAHALALLAGGDPVAAAAAAAATILRDQEGADWPLLAATGDFLCRRFLDAPATFVGPLLDAIAAAGPLAALRCFRAVFQSLALELKPGVDGWLVEPVERWPEHVRQAHELLHRHLMPTLRPELLGAAPKLKALLQLEALGAWEKVQAFRWRRPQVLGVCAACLEHLQVPGWPTAWARLQTRLSDWTRSGRFWPACETRLKLYREHLGARRQAASDDTERQAADDALTRLGAVEAQLRLADAKGVRVRALDLLPVFADEPRPLWWLIIKELGLEPAALRSLLKG